MINKITVTNYLGESIGIELREPAKSGFLITKIDGLGPPKASINTNEVSNNDGSIFSSARMSERNITMDITFIYSNLGEDIEDIRQKSYKYFPVKKPLMLIIETDNRTAYALGYVESNEPDIFSEEESTTISILCPDSYLYALNQHTTVFSGIEATFEFPFSNESLTEDIINFGTILQKTENVIYYQGDAEIGVSISIHAIGTVENIDIYNVTTREIMSINTDKIQELTDVTFGNGDDIIINTNKNNKSITLVHEGQFYNILNCINRNTSWFRLTKGDNIFAFTAEYGTSNIQFNISNSIIYEGI